MVNVYPPQYHLPELTAHLVALLERRRAAAEEWTSGVEASLLDEAARALEDARRQFLEVTGDEAYWTRTAAQLLSVAVPRYLKLARAQHQLERRRYGVWRGGDFLSRAVYAVGGLLVGVLILRTALPDWLEPVPLAFFIGGPLIPDLQVWLAQRRYRRQLTRLVEEMREEQEDTSAYLPLGVDRAPESPAEVPPTPERTRERG